jgi:hypothetical protein
VLGCSVVSMKRKTGRRECVFDAGPKVIRVSGAT